MEEFEINAGINKDADRSGNDQTTDSIGSLEWESNAKGLLIKCTFYQLLIICNSEFFQMKKK